jgi:hypothetical protein
VLGSHDELEDFPRDLSAYELVAELEAVAALEVQPDRTA